MIQSKRNKMEVQDIEEGRGAGKEFMKWQILWFRILLPKSYEKELIHGMQKYRLVHQVKHDVERREGQS